MDSVKRLGIVSATAAGATVLALSAATQFQAASFHYPAEFGSSLHHLYAPWAVLGWARTWAKTYPTAFLHTFMVGALVFTLPTLIALLATRVGRSVQAFGKTAWAGSTEVSKAKLFAAGGVHGRVLGEFRKRLLIYAGIEHAIVVGATRSGKGAGHVTPSLMTWAQSAFVYDRKGELYELTADHRKTFSHVMRFAPTSPDTVRYNPLFEVRKGPREIADIQNVVGVIIDPLGRNGGDLSFWDQKSGELFTALILHILYTAEPEKKTIAHLRELLLNADVALAEMQTAYHRLRPDLHAADGYARDGAGEVIPETHPECANVAGALLSLDIKVRTSIIASAQAALTLWADPMVQHATSWSDFSIGELVCSKNPVTLYVTTPQSDADRLAPLVRILLRQVIDRLMEDIRVDSRGNTKNHRLLLMLDEFPKLGNISYFERALGEMAGYGLTAHLICQSFNDVVQQYGPNTTLFDNMHITVAFATSEPGNIKKVIERAGKALEYRKSYSNSGIFASSGRNSINTSEQQRHILSEGDVRGLDDNKELIFVNGVKPILADKIRYWEKPWFAKRAGGFFHGELAAYQQASGNFDLPGRPQIDWLEPNSLGAGARSESEPVLSGGMANPGGVAPVIPVGAIDPFVDDFGDDAVG
jgi:type IV secretion system protein VirD4